MITKELKDFQFTGCTAIKDVITQLNAYAKLMLGNLETLAKKIAEVEVAAGQDGPLKAEISAIHREMHGKIADLAKKFEAEPKAEDKKSYAQAVSKLTKEVTQLKVQVKKSEAKIEADIYAGAIVLNGVDEAKGDSLVAAVKETIPRLSGTFFRARRLGYKRENGQPRPILVTPVNGQMMTSELFEAIKNELPDEVKMRRFIPPNLMEAESALYAEGKKLNPVKEDNISYFQVRGWRLKVVNRDGTQRLRYDNKLKKVVPTDEDEVVFDGFFPKRD